MRSRLLPSLFLPFVVAVVPAPVVVAQNASVALFGTGCTFNSQPLAISVQGLPQLGTTFTINYSGPNLNNQLMIRPALALGLASTNIPIPMSILPTQPSGCTQWIVPELISLMPTTPSGSFVTQVSVTIPNDPSLTGFVLTAQWLAIAVQCGIIPPCWLTALPTSNAALLTVGI
ncbi:MAG: hypothetical protein ABIP94_04040 [Planctomycetota bacterium]